MFDKRRHFIIRAQQAKRAAPQAANDAGETVTVNGRQVQVTDANRRFVENMLARDAERAFEAAVYHRPYQSRIAIAA